MSHPPQDSNAPFDRQDSMHGPSRGEIAFRLKTLEDGQSKIFDELKALSIALAATPKMCPQADKCQDLWKEVDNLRLEEAKKQGALWMSKAGMIIVSSSIGALAAVVATWFLVFPHGKP